MSALRKGRAGSVAWGATATGSLSAVTSARAAAGVAAGATTSAAASAARAAAAVWGWAWDLVAVEGLVDVDGDAWVGSLVEGSSSNTSWLSGTGTGDLDVDACFDSVRSVWSRQSNSMLELTLWVVLGAVLLTSRVKSNDLVTEDVVAWGDVAWDGHFTSEVVGYRASVSILIRCG